ncbi:MAG: hypothetical protein HN370_00170 [Phycisphaerales bacterium]|jgi:hypothetical protein|nr:hypothetical protein [Phycisphaerales bacterium]
MQRSRLIQILCLLAALGCFAAAGLLQGSMYKTYAKENTQFADDLRIAQQSHPAMAMLSALPGAAKALGSNFLWIRSNTLHREGKHFDAQQLSEMICALQPHQPGVWNYQAWNMAWNISSKCHARSQRWHWIYRGVKLLRDQGIPRNPRSIELYKQLAWTFFSKMGGRVDEQNLSYKERWAGIMQRLLGAPPYQYNPNESLAQQTQRVIDAFGPIVAAPLDRNPVRQGKEMIQQDQLALVLTDPAVKAYADRLAAMQIYDDSQPKRKLIPIQIDRSLLLAYNRYSNDSAVTSARPPIAYPWKSKRDLAALALLNEGGEAKRARDGLLAFVRAQLLWNEFRMDPIFMHKLMNRYKVPLDWRHVMAHALYWSSLGKERCAERMSNFMRINNNRGILNALKRLTNTGVLSIQWRGNDPDFPIYKEMPDLRYIEPTHKQHIAFGREEFTLANEDKRIKEFHENTFSVGHVNYLIKAIDMLVADGRTGGLKPKVGTAQYYYDYIRREYKRRDSYWVNDDVRDFVAAEMASESLVPRYEIAQPVMELSIRRALVLRGLYSNKKGYDKTMKFARRLHAIYQQSSTPGNRLEPFDKITVNVLITLLSRPEVYGMTLDIDQRSDLYQTMNDTPRLQAYIYHYMEQFLGALCYQTGKSMKAAFPKPANYEALMEEYRQLLRKAAAQHQGTR